MSSTLIQNATIASAEGLRLGSVLISGDRISDISYDGQIPSGKADVVIDATGYLLFPGIIDGHVHFREPGLTHKATIASESRAAVAGGVTTVFDMPNCIPQTTTIQALHDKCDTAARDSLTNYSFYLGATHDNISQIGDIDPATTCGVKLFMGSSTGNMLVDDRTDVLNILKASPVLVAAHCEDSGIISRNMQHYTELCGTEPPVSYHPLIRSAEACYASSALAIELADKASAHLHLLHISTARELSLLRQGDVRGKNITAEACPAHLFFTDADYGTLGSRIKCNPAIKTRNDREALRSAVASGLIDVVGTDHAPHLLEEKTGGCKSAASGMPVLPYSLSAMLEMADEGAFSICDIVRTMCNNPARLFNIKERGFIRAGYKADLTLVKKHTDNDRDAGEWTVRDDSVPNRCGWSPFDGYKFKYKVAYTWVNGNPVYSQGIISDNYRGEQVIFDRL